MITYSKLLDKTPKQLLTSLKHWKWKKKDIINLLESYEVINHVQFFGSWGAWYWQDDSKIFEPGEFEKFTFLDLCVRYHDEIVECICEEYTNS